MGYGGIGCLRELRWGKGWLRRESWLKEGMLVKGGGVEGMNR